MYRNVLILLQYGACKKLKKLLFAPLSGPVKVSVIFLVVFCGVYTGLAGAESDPVSPEPCQNHLVLDPLTAGFEPVNEAALKLSAQEEASLEETFKAEPIKKSDRSPRPQVWMRIRASLLRHVREIEHPLESAGQNADQISQAYKRMGNEFSKLRGWLNLYYLVEQGQIPTYADFIEIKRSTANQLIAIAQRPRNPLQVFAAQETLRLLSTIETFVEFPEIQKEDKERQEKQEIHIEDEEQKPKDKQKQNDEIPQWNDTPNTYDPENRDISSDGEPSSAINADLLLTDAETPAGLLRQEIYDQFNLTNWSSVPVSREPLEAEAKAEKKLTIIPFENPFVHIPIPYNYTLKAETFSGHKVVETGPGTFVLKGSGTAPVTLDLYKVSKQGSMPYPPGANQLRGQDEDLKKWPTHLLLYTQSLKGLPPLKATAKLQEYITEVAGFLYFSKGDKVKSEDLIQLGRKYQELKKTLPKPMAMAHLGAFNCDGAAWIGALLLRDVLNIRVRIVGGRVLSGHKTVNEEKLWVLKSSSPAHAWIEVFDGTLWVPFDFTPNENRPDSLFTASELDRDDEHGSEPGRGGPNEGSAENSERLPTEVNSHSQEGAKEETENQVENSPDIERERKVLDKTWPQENMDESESFVSKSVEDLINARSTLRRAAEQNLGLIERVLRRVELMTLERLINQGYQTNFTRESEEIYKTLLQNSVWRKTIERSRSRVSAFIQDAKFAKFLGLRDNVSEVRAQFSLGQVRQARQNLLVVKRLFLKLGEYRNLTPEETESLNSIQKIVRILEEIKHKNSREFDIVDRVLSGLPGNLSKSWLRTQYGEDINTLGSLANLSAARDFVTNRLKPILQMSALKEFVDLNLNSTVEPQYQDEVTFNRSLIPKARQDLIITRNPLDFARMLWSPRPGEHLFAPTLMGRQFAVGSLETRIVVDPVNPSEKKMTLIYPDISPSMEGPAAEVQDAIVMASVDKALSEVDLLGRPKNEVYIIPFAKELQAATHISSREAALAFLARRMNMRSNSEEGTNIQKPLEHFYELIANSYREKAAQGRDTVFQRANMVLISDGASVIDLERLQEKRKAIPPNVHININFISIGDSENQELKELATASDIATRKPRFHKLDAKRLNSIADISIKYDPDAFATEKKLSGRQIAEINSLLAEIFVDPVQAGSTHAVDRALSLLRITNTEVSQLSGLRVVLNLIKLEKMLSVLELSSETKIRLLDSVLESYEQESGRTWSEMTYSEKDAFENLRAWAVR